MNKLVLKRIGFYFLSFTWGIITSIIGLLIIGFSALCGRVHTYHGRLYATWGKGWGGFEMGPFFVIGEDCQSCCAHESGHGIQNIILGPFMIFVVSIPSCIRYWYREIIRRKDPEKYKQLPSYDSMWFEGWATSWGRKFVETDRI